MKLSEYVSFEFGKRLIETLDLLGDKCYNLLSSHPSITFSHLLLYIDKPWNWFKLSRHENIKFTDILENLNLNWNWKGVSMNPNISFIDIINHPELPWDFLYVSENPNIKFQDLDEKIEWDWSALSRHINARDILNNKHLPWDVYQLCSNSSFTFQEIQEYPNIFIDSWQLSGVSEIKDISKFKCSFWKLSENKNLTLDFILKNKNRNWNWEYLNLKFNLPKDIINYFNLIPKNITFDNIKLDKNKFSLEDLSNFRFEYQYDLIKKECLEKWRAVNLIKKNYIIAFWDLKYKLGRKRLERSLSEDYSVW